MKFDEAMILSFGFAMVFLAVGWRIGSSVPFTLTSAILAGLAAPLILVVTLFALMRKRRRKRRTEA